MERKRIVVRALCFLPHLAPAGSAGGGAGSSSEEDTPRGERSSSGGAGGAALQLVAVEKEFSFHWRKRSAGAARDEADEESGAGRGNAMRARRIKCRHFAAPAVLCAPLGNGVWASRAQFERYSLLARSVKAIDGAPMRALRRELERTVMRLGRSGSLARASGALLQLAPWANDARLAALLVALRTHASSGAARFDIVARRLRLVREALSVGAATSKEGTRLTRRAVELSGEVARAAHGARLLVCGASRANQHRGPGAGKGTAPWAGAGAPWRPTSHTARFESDINDAVAPLRAERLERTMRALSRHEVVQARVRAQAMVTDPNRQLNQTFGASVETAAAMATTSHATLQPAAQYARWALFRRGAEIDDSPALGALALGRLERVCATFATALGADVDAASGGLVAREVDALWAASGRSARRERHLRAVRDARAEEEAKNKKGFAGIFGGGAKTDAKAAAAAARKRRGQKKRGAKVCFIDRSISCDSCMLTI